MVWEVLESPIGFWGDSTRAGLYFEGCSESKQGAQVHCVCSTPSFQPTQTHDFPLRLSFAQGQIVSAHALFSEGWA